MPWPLFSQGCAACSHHQVGIVLACGDSCFDAELLWRRSVRQSWGTVLGVFEIALGAVSITTRISFWFCLPRVSSWTICLPDMSPTRARETLAALPLRPQGSNQCNRRTPVPSGMCTRRVRRLTLATFLLFLVGQALDKQRPGTRPGAWREDCSHEVSPALHIVGRTATEGLGQRGRHCTQ